MVRFLLEVVIVIGKAPSREPVLHGTCSRKKLSRWNYLINGIRREKKDNYSHYLMAGTITNS